MKELWPRPAKPVKAQVWRKWRVDYQLAYDGGELAMFSTYHRTKFGAYVAAWWHYNIASYGGTATLFLNQEDRT
jgi:hypothetical protein